MSDRSSVASVFDERPPRRKFLTWLGAGGLAAAAGVFGHTGTAQASCGLACCNLIYCPPNESISACMNHPGSYTWICNQDQCQSCYCCEDWAGHSAQSCSSPGC